MIKNKQLSTRCAWTLLGGIRFAANCASRALVGGLWGHTSNESASEECSLDVIAVANVFRCLTFRQLGIIQRQRWGPGVDQLAAFLDLNMHAQAFLIRAARQFFGGFEFKILIGGVA